MELTPALRFCHIGIPPLVGEWICTKLLNSVAPHAIASCTSLHDCRRCKKIFRTHRHTSMMLSRKLAFPDPLSKVEKRLSMRCLFCRYNPIKTIKTSFIGTMNMLGLAKRTHARFLLTSTSEASAPQALPQLKCPASQGTWCMHSRTSLCMCLQ